MKLHAYLTFNGNCEEAMNFYAACLGGEIVEISRFGDAPMPISEEAKNKIMHIRMTFGDATLMASDTNEGQTVNFGDNITLSVGTTDIEETNTIFAQLAEGGNITMELQDTFWGAKFGMLTDKFGVSWMFNCELPKA
jgi:PhnB protein